MSDEQEVPDDGVPLWRAAGSGDDEAELSRDFSRTVLSRAQRHVTVRDYLGMFVQGFLSILLGFMAGAPKRDQDQPQNEVPKQ